METEVFRTIIDFINDGYEVKLTKNSIVIVEPYKSTCREKYIEKIIFEVVGSISYFEKGALRITLEKLKRWRDNLEL